MISDKNRVYDGWTSIESGVDAGRSPSLVDVNQCVSAKNMVFRGGTAKTRPGFRKLTETFTNPTHSYDLRGVDALTQQIPGQEASTIYRSGVMQGAIGYSAPNGEDYLIAMIGGRLFRITPLVDTSTVLEITPIKDTRSPYEGMGYNSQGQAYRNDKNRTLAYMLQADKWLIVQDGQAKPILYDGATARRADTDTLDSKVEMPTGSHMAYGMGRICVVVNEKDIAFGDLFGSHLDTQTDPADSLILFTERTFLAEGFDAAIPFGQGIATGMVFFPQLDTSTGNGQLLVFAERGAASFFLSLPREQWKTSQFQILALLTTGLRGHRSITVVNEDLWFRANDGMRSYRQARSEASGWAHIPLSTNVSQFIDNDSKTLLKYASSIYFDNRIITTCSPFYNQGRPTHAGMVVVDFDIISSFGTKYKPAWEGNWTMPQTVVPNGIFITQLFTGTFKGVTRAFAFGIDTDNKNQLYEITTDQRDDWDGQRIDWELQSRSFDFQKLSQQSSPFTEVELYDADLWLREIIE